MPTKIFVFILTFSLISNTNGNPHCELSLDKIAPINDGFYGGLSLGHRNLVGQLNRTLNANASDRITSVGENGIATGVFAGYQKIIDGKIYIAGEGFYQYADILIEKEENAFPGNINYFTYIKNSHKTGIVGKIGFVHFNNLFYLKTGIALSNFTLGFKDNGCNVCLIQGGNSSISKLQKGLIVGGGIEYFINKNVGIGMEYEITSYPSMNFKSNNVGSFSFKSTSHTFQLRFKYTL